MRNNLRGFGLFLGLFWISLATAMDAPATRDWIEKGIREDLRARKGRSFDELPSRWEKKYGAESLPVLAALARNRKLDEFDRYVALMSAVRLGGYGTASFFQDLLEDPSWVLRSGELRLLKATGKKDPGLTPVLQRRILVRLKDPALAVRAEAVETVEELRIPGAVSALLAVLQDERNYPGGKALWVPQKALRALEELGGPRCLPWGRVGIRYGICRE